ncbi:hypothetical protein CS542_03110 [Pedobacter sp. IW39]|nr:hypothetical protein CS542_03110 [Pedobacter sp. IW39]
MKAKIPLDKGICNDCPGFTGGTGISIAAGFDGLIMKPFRKVICLMFSVQPRCQRIQFSNKS